MDAAPDAAPPAASRLLRLHAFEFLIFGVLFVLLALCLAAAPLISGGEAGSGPAATRLV